jgi:hypothetical protein
MAQTYKPQESVTAAMIKLICANFHLYSSTDWSSQLQHTLVIALLPPSHWLFYMMLNRSFCSASPSNSDRIVGCPCVSVAWGSWMELEKRGQVPLAFPIRHTQGSTLVRDNHLFSILDPMVVFNTHVGVIAHVDARHAFATHGAVFPRLSSTSDGLETTSLEDHSRRTWLLHNCSC